MKRYIFTLFFFLTLVKGCSAEIVPVFPPNGKILDNPTIHFKWENTDKSQEYIYAHTVSPSENFSIGLYNGNLLQPEVYSGLQNYSIYYWKVEYHPLNSFTGKYSLLSDTFFFAVNKDIPESILKKYLKSPTDNVNGGKKDISEEENTKSQDKVVEEYPFLEDRQSATSTNNSVIASSDTYNNLEEFNWNTRSSTAVLGESDVTKDVVCKFKYLKKEKTSYKVFCNMPKIFLKEQGKYLLNNQYSVYVSGEVKTSFKIQVDEYDCVSELFKPSTWFRCEERFLQTKFLHIYPNMFFHILRKGSRVTPLTFSLDNGNFILVSSYISDTENIELEHVYRIVNSEHNVFLDERRRYALNPITQNLASGEGKTFGFPFTKNIGVTQWYGYTQYQSPHTGIDFGSYRESVLAIADGEVVSKGWDNYFGECLSGGYFLKIKQNNGMYTVYFHLEEIYVNTGDLVKKEQVVAKSGNSGAWNCQRLAYHLHFETRLDSSSKSHSNPVKYVNTDWNSIPTLGYQIYPGRLSGENPHPGR
jgi:hypothetical protein